MDFDNIEIDVSIPYPLEYTWVLWYHLPSKDSEWTVEKAFEFSTIQDFWHLYNNFPYNPDCFYFLMRKGILPKWEDPANKTGGCWSFIVSKFESSRAWYELSMACIGGCLTKDPNLNEMITGISMSQKEMISNIKIWNNDADKSVASEYFDSMLPVDYPDSRCKSCKEAGKIQEECKMCYNRFLLDMDKSWYGSHVNRSTEQNPAKQVKQVKQAKQVKGGHRRKGRDEKRGEKRVKKEVRISANV